MRTSERGVLAAASLVTAVASLAVAASLLPAAPARAHATLAASSPRNGQRVVDAPQVVSLRFDDPVQRTFARVVVTAPDGTPVSGGRPVATDRTVSVRLGSLPGEGRYTVAYRVVSRDGHPVTGTVTFTYDLPRAVAATPGTKAAKTGGAAGSAPAGAETGRRGTAEARSAGPLGGHGLHVAAGLVVVVGALVVLWHERRRS